MNYLLGEKDIEINFVYALSSIERFNILKGRMSYKHISNTYIDRWKKRKSIVNEKSFMTKLKLEGLTEQQFNYAIKDLNHEEKKILFDELKNMDWYKNFISSITSYKIERDGKILCNDIRFPIRNFLLWAISEIKKSKNGLEIVFTNKAMESLEYALTGILVDILQKSLTIELHDWKNKSKLIGSDSQKRYEYFIKNCFANTDSILTFYSKYPTLGRLLTIKTMYFITNISESMQRLDKNINEIIRHINADIQNKNVIDIKCNMGDSHQKGRGVIKFVFENNINLIYKPKNLKIEENYYKFLKWLNESSNLMDLYLNKGIYKEKYTFEGYIEHKDCKSEDELKNYYIRYGQIVAITYILCGTDFHAENLIARGQYPCIIDLETLFENVIELDNYESADKLIMTSIRESVLSSGLLPFEAFNENLKNEGIDMSALSGKEEKLPYKISIPINVMTDEMKFQDCEYIRNGSENLPKIDGVTANYRKYTDYIIKGFRDTCEFIMRNKELFIKKNGIIDIFDKSLVRQVIKGTNRYYNMLQFSTHPNCTKDFLEREKLFENLWGYNYQNKKVVEHEIKDMLFHDIPVFFAYNDSKDIITSDGKNIESYYKETSKNMVIDKIRKLDSNEINRQISCMIISFGRYLEKSSESLKDTYWKANVVKIDGNKINYLDSAIEIAEYLITQSKCSDKTNTINWEYIDCNGVVDKVLPLKGDFNNGISGIALFFLKLYKVTLNKQYKNISEMAIKYAVDTSKFLNVGNVYEGRVSLLFPLINFFMDTEEVYYKNEIDKIIQYVDNEIEQISIIDNYGGITGITQVMLSMKFVSDTHERIIEKLLNKLNLEIDNSNMYSYDTLSEIVLTFLLYGEKMNKKQYIDYAFEYLKDYMEKPIEYKKITNSKTLINILIINKILKKYGTDIGDNALQYIIGKDNLDDCLYDGNMGDIDFIIEYGKMNNIKMERYIEKKLDALLKNKAFKIRYIPYFVPKDIFKGISGIGYEMLRLAYPYKVPSIYNFKL